MADPLIAKLIEADQPYQDVFLLLGLSERNARGIHSASFFLRSITNRRRAYGACIESVIVRMRSVRY